MANEAGEGAIVAEDCVFTGKVRGQHLTVLGTLEGEVVVAGRLSVGRKGKVKAAVKAAEVTVEGEVDGDIRTERLTLTESARAKGTFVAGRLVVKEGAVIEGAINPSDLKPHAGDPPKPAAAPVAAEAKPIPIPTPAVKAEGAKHEESKADEKKDVGVK
jgi:cytoskeletal protein CcmA (bactofilin family)